LPTMNIPKNFGNKEVGSRESEDRSRKTEDRGQKDRNLVTGH